MPNMNDRRDRRFKLEPTLPPDGFSVIFSDDTPTNKQMKKKTLRETQTLCAGCSKAEPKNFVPPQTPFRGAGRPKFNQLEMVTTFIYKPSLVKIDARTFELSY